MTRKWINHATRYEVDEFIAERLEPDSSAAGVYTRDVWPVFVEWCEQHNLSTVRRKRELMVVLSMRFAFMCDGLTERGGDYRAMQRGDELYRGIGWVPAERIGQPNRWRIIMAEGRMPYVMRFDETELAAIKASPRGYSHGVGPIAIW